MNNTRLEQLLKMAAEAERMEFGERTASPGRLRSIDSRSSIGRHSAAAALLVASAIGLYSWSTSETDTLDVAKTDVKQSDITTLNTASCEEESTVLLALFHKADGIAGRATMALRNWDAHRSLNDLGEGELIGLAFEHSHEVTPESLPDSVILLAVSGPMSLIPHSDAEATTLAACLENTPASCGEEVPCFTSAALACLPPGVTVRGESRIVR